MYKSSSSAMGNMGDCGGASIGVLYLHDDCRSFRCCKEALPACRAVHFATELGDSLCWYRTTSTILDVASSALMLDDALTSADLAFRHESVGFLLPHSLDVVACNAHSGFSIPEKPLYALVAATHSLHVLLHSP
jgi:hypothetical protein